MLGQYPTNVPGLDPSATRKEWGFTTTEFNEIMKHIQVLGPAIQKVIFLIDLSFLNLTSYGTYHHFILFRTRSL